jgi:hypothetical protein
MMPLATLEEAARMNTPIYDAVVRDLQFNPVKPLKEKPILRSKKKKATRKANEIIAGLNA